MDDFPSSFQFVTTRKVEYSISIINSIGKINWPLCSMQMLFRKLHRDSCSLAFFVVICLIVGVYWNIMLNQIVSFSDRKILCWAKQEIHLETINRSKSEKNTELKSSWIDGLSSLLNIP